MVLGYMQPADNTKKDLTDNNTKKEKERECVKKLEAFEQMQNHTKHGQIRGQGPKAHQPLKGQTFVLYEDVA